MRYISFLLIFLLLPILPVQAEDAAERLEAKTIYAQGLEQLTLYHLSLDRSRLADAIRFFKDAVSADPQYSRAYYALVAGIEEYEAGSSERIGDALRELVENIFDPFSSGAEAATDIASLEVLGVCMERLRRLTSATKFTLETKTPLEKILPVPPHCPLDGNFSLKPGKSGNRAICSLHGEPLGPDETASSFEATAARLMSPAMAAFRSGIQKLHTAVGEPSLDRIKQIRQEAAREFLKARRLDSNLVEAYVGCIAVLDEAGLNPQEQEIFTAEYRKLLKDLNQKRFARHAAGELLNMEYSRRCDISRLLLTSALEMYALESPDGDPDQVDRVMLKTKGYLKQDISCPRGGTLNANGKKGSIKVICSVHK